MVGPERREPRATEIPYTVQGCPNPHAVSLFPSRHLLKSQNHAHRAEAGLALPAIKCSRTSISRKQGLRTAGSQSLLAACWHSWLHSRKHPMIDTNRCGAITALLPMLHTTSVVPEKGTTAAMTETSHQLKHSMPAVAEPPPAQHSLRSVRQQQSRGMAGTGSSRGSSSTIQIHAAGLRLPLQAPADRSQRRAGTRLAPASGPAQLPREQMADLGACCRLYHRVLVCL